MIFIDVGDFHGPTIVKSCVAKTAEMKNVYGIENSKMHCVLSDRNILEEISNGNIIIEPFDRESLANCSYDVRLGEYYYRSNPNVKILNPWNKQQIERYWGEPKNADVVTEEIAEELGMEVGQRYIRLYPGETILGHTDEFIGGRNNIVTMMRSNII